MAPIGTVSSTVRLLFHESYFTFLVVGTIGTSFLLAAIMCICCCKRTQKAKALAADSKVNTSMNPSSPTDNLQKSTKLSSDIPDSSSKRLGSPPMKAIPGSPGAPVTPSPSSSKSTSRSPVANSPSMKLKQQPANQPLGTAASVRPKQTTAEATSNQLKATTARAPYKTEEQASDRSSTGQQAKSMDDAPPPLKATATTQSLNMETSREKVNDGTADLQSKYHQTAVTCIDTPQSAMPPVAPSIQTDRPPVAESMKQSAMVPKDENLQTPVNARTLPIFGKKKSNKKSPSKPKKKSNKKSPKPAEVQRKRKGPTEKVIRVINFSTREEPSLLSRY